MSGRRILRRLRTLSPAEWRLLPEALATVAAVRLALSFLPVSRVLRRVEARASRMERGRRHAGDPPPRRIAGCVRSASRLVPGATCLTQALSARLLLSRRGWTSTVRIGVLREEGEFRAHAWLEAEGRVLIGGDVAPRYRELLNVSRTMATAPRGRSRSTTQPIG